MGVVVTQGDCVSVLAAREGPLFDSVVTDPPYHLTSIVERFGKEGSAPAQVGETGTFARASKGFMGQEWDGGDVAFRPETWREIYNQMKPGAHLAAFSGTRTYHRMACAIEDAGFEIREMIAWTYGSGFPKSHNVSKALDRMAGADREVLSEGKPVKRMIPGADQAKAGWVKDNGREFVPTDTAPTSDAAKQWDGWGTALKPAWENICLAQKPNLHEVEWVTIKGAIERLWSRIWLMLPASIVGQCSGLNPVACGVDESVFAQCLVERQSNSPEDLQDQMDTLQFASALLSSLSTVSSWSATLGESWRAASTSTTSTESSATTELRTLRSSLLKITPGSIILAHKSGRWLSADACNAGRLFSALVAKLSATLELSAAVNATNWDAIDCPDAGEIAPNLRPICLARKPLSESSVARNVIAHGTGAIHIDACRVGDFVNTMPPGTDRYNAANHAHGYRPSAYGRDGEDSSDRRYGDKGSTSFNPLPGHRGGNPEGRFPANILHDGSDDVLDAFPDAPGQQYAVKGTEPSSPFANIYGDMPNRNGRAEPRGDSGSAARFYFSAKAGPLDRLGSGHATIKPVDLMRWLCRLITPPGGLILDPFGGSGTTGIAAIAEGFNAELIELLPDHVTDINRKLAIVTGMGRHKAVKMHERRNRESGASHNELPLFGG